MSNYLKHAYYHSWLMAPATVKCNRDHMACNTNDLEPHQCVNSEVEKKTEPQCMYDPCKGVRDIGNDIKAVILYLYGRWDRIKMPEYSDEQPYECIVLY